MNWRLVVKRVLAPMLVLMLSWSMVSCSQSGSVARKSLLTRSQNRLAEIAPPAAIQELKQYTDVYQPQVTILSPRPDEVLQDTQTAVKLQVRDLPLSKDKEFELGYHLHFILDNQPYQAVFNADQPIALNDLEPGTHTIRVFASRPWHESFKTEGAFAQTTFHVFAKTPETQPDLNKPLLTYSRPKGDYGAEPVLLDFYLTNAPLHFVAQEDSQDAIPDWQIRCTVNGESFTFDRWEPIYLEGLKPGRNWIQLELLDEDGNPILNGFNNTVRIVNYQPNGSDALSRLVRGEIPLTLSRRLVDPDYMPPIAAPPAAETPEETATELPAAEIPETAAEETVELKRDNTPEEDIQAAPEVPAVLKQPAAEESIREELADEVKEELEDESAQPASQPEGLEDEFPGEAAPPVLPLPTAQPAEESPDREKFTSKFSDKFSGARERAKGLMQRMRKSDESAPEPSIESAPDAAAVPPVLKAPPIETVPDITPEAIPDNPKSLSIPPSPELDDLPPTLPEIIEQPNSDQPPSRLPAPIPRFLTLRDRWAIRQATPISDQARRASGKISIASPNE